MKDYKRLTKQVFDKVQGCEDKMTMHGQNLYDLYNRLAELEDKIENARTVEIHYKPPFETKYAIVEYYARQGKPLKVAEYNIYGEELKTGEQLICWEYLSSTNFSVIENGFNTRAEAEKKLEILKGGVK